MTDTMSPVTTPLRLTTNVPASGQADSVIPVSWALSPEAMAELSRRWAKDVHIVLIVQSRQGERYEERERYLVPATDRMKYVRFDRAGENRVLAMVVWGQYSRVSNYILSRSHNGRHKNELTDYNGELYEHFSGGWFNYLPGSDCLNVHVPAEMFAPEPSKWVMRYVGLLYRGRGADECSLRRRILTTTAALPALVAWRLLKLVAAEVIQLLFIGFCLLNGLRGIRYRGLLHPLSFDMGQTVPEDTSSVWWYRADDTERHPISWVLNPPLLLVATGLALLLHHFGRLPLSVPLLIGLLMAVGVVVLLVVKYLPHNAIKDSRRRLRTAARERELAVLAKFTATPQSVAPLPEPHGVILRYQALKARVCKPYAR